MGGGLSGQLAAACQHCAWIAVRLMISTWSWGECLKGLVVEAGFVAGKCLRDQQSTKLPKLRRLPSWEVFYAPPLTERGC